MGAAIVVAGAIGLQLIVQLCRRRQLQRLREHGSTDSLDEDVEIEVEEPKPSRPRGRWPWQSEDYLPLEEWRQGMERSD